MTTRALVRVALAEDRVRDDITSRLTIPADLSSRAVLVARAPGVACGLDVCAEVFAAVDRRVRFAARFRDGRPFRAGAVLAAVSGPARSILSGERTALNFVQRLSGIATLTHRFVAAVACTGAVILDTRKTIPGWRELDKRAVRAGGGTNHRSNLAEMVLIKDNHIAAAGSTTAALERCQGARLPIEVECGTLAEVRTALAAGARRVLLDNMTLAQMRRAVALARGRARLEASGGITLSRVRAVALTGVDFISVGALTHSAPAADIALDFLHK